MTVYFVKAVVDDSKIKIGTTTDLPSRLQALSAEYEAGVELLAVCEGGEETERAFHSLFASDRLEGEWFRRTERLEQLIEPLSENVRGRRVWSRLRAVQEIGSSALDEDQEIARGLLQQIMGKFGAIHFGVAQTRAFEELYRVNPIWTRRRVRSIWERKARRIDHFEVRNLQTVLREWDSPQMEAYRRASGGLGRSNSAGNQGG